RRDDDRQLDRLRDLGQGGIGLDSEDARPARVDRENGPAERAADEVPDERPADAPLLLRRADDGDRGRPEEGVERVTTDAQDVRRVVRSASRGRIGHRDHQRTAARDEPHEAAAYPCALPRLRTPGAVSILVLGAGYGPMNSTARTRATAARRLRGRRPRA